MRLFLCETVLLRPTPSYQSDNSRPEEEELEDILPGLRSGLITVTHSVFTITREQQGETEPGFTYPYPITNQRKAKNAPSRGFGCLELVHYGIRELA